MRRRSETLLLLTIGAFAALAQAPPVPKKAEAGGFIFKVESRLVVLHATVLDKDNHLVTNLPQAAFKVFENNVQQALKLFRREDVPVSIGLVIDNSGSMRDKREKVNAAALAFVKASNPHDEMFVVNFNDEAFEDQPFTSDQELLQEALRKIDQRGGTAFFDAVSLSLDNLREKGKKDKKAVLLITDGEDNASQVTLEKLLRKVGESETAIFTIGLLNEEERRAARRTRRALETLAEASGGEAFFPKDLNEVDDIARKIALDLRSQYILGYTPTNEAQDGGFRQVKIVLTGAGKSHNVRTRTGYYARGAATAARASGSQ